MQIGLWDTDHGEDAMSNSSIPGVPNSAGILTYGIDNGIIKKFLAGVDHSGTGYVLRVE